MARVVCSKSNLVLHTTYLAMSMLTFWLHNKKEDEVPWMEVYPEEVIQWLWPRDYNTGKGGFVCLLKISWAMLGNIMERLGNSWKSENFITTGMVILAQRHRCRYRHTDVETSFCMVLHTALSVYRRMCISTWRCFYIRVSIDTTTGIHIRI